MILNNVLLMVLFGLPPMQYCRLRRMRRFRVTLDMQYTHTRHVYVYV